MKYYFDLRGKPSTFEEFAGQWASYEIELNNVIKNIIENQTEITKIIYGIGAIIIVLGIAIILNQRKIKKQLRQLLDQKEDKDVS